MSVNSKLAAGISSRFNKQNCYCRPCQKTDHNHFNSDIVHEQGINVMKWGINVMKWGINIIYS